MLLGTFSARLLGPKELVRAPGSKRAAPRAFANMASLSRLVSCWLCKSCRFGWISMSISIYIFSSVCMYILMCVCVCVMCGCVGMCARIYKYISNKYILHPPPDTHVYYIVTTAPAIAFPPPTMAHLGPRLVNATSSFVFSLRLPFSIFAFRFSFFVFLFSFLVFLSFSVF